MRVLFYGTPPFALPTLEALLASHEVVGVVTQPDRPAGRGQRLTPPPVKERAIAAAVPVLQPPRLGDPGWLEPLRAFGADLAVVVAFGQILPKAVLDVPARGSINVHASLLPKYRGAAPIAWALIRGESETGITTFQMDEGMDTGPILLSERTAIRPGETAGELGARLARLGARVLIDTLARLDTIVPTPQQHGDATLAPRLRKTEGHLDWREPARALVNRIHGCNPRPGALTRASGGRLTIWRARAVARSAGDIAPGTLIAGAGGVCIAAGDGAVEPIEVQPENRRVVAWPAYLRGARLRAGDRLGPA
ncbi:MAG: methionyl-tRNA formyltransferase [Candidatus Rokuibacteriota bacterium]|nr:MAG: methionyl-tRNA formyltransferase [Candidatus Rokubacteria bacterium]